MSHKMLIITGTYNEKKKTALTIYGILCRKITILNLQELTPSEEKLKALRSSKLNFSSSYFIADDSQIKIVWLHVVVFREHDILHF